MKVHDKRVCALGEGPVWHPLREQLFWFDIMAGKLLCDTGEEWQFDGTVSAAGWISETALLIASDTGLLRFDLDSGAQRLVCALEADNAATRSNDGRADPWGGFWIGTMGKAAEPDAGAIYRYYGGELHRLFAPLTITNSICFAPDRSVAYFADTATRQIMRVPLAPEDGFPSGPPVVHLDLGAQELNPDGSVIAANGTFVNAQWGAGRVACYTPQGQFLQAYDLPTDQITCPAFGGPELRTLFVTSAADGLDGAQPHAGQTFAIPTDFAGQAEHRVIL